MNDMYNTFSNININYYDSSSFKRPTKEYLVNKEEPVFSWNYGDTIKLEFKVSGKINVDSSSIIYYGNGEEPTSSTQGYVDQKAFNVTELKSWTCTFAEIDNYTWVQDETFVYPTSGDKSIYVTASNYLLNRLAKVTIYNFRHEQIHNWEVEATPLITIPIDSMTSETIFKPGVYYCGLVVEEKDFSERRTVINPEDCCIYVR